MRRTEASSPTFDRVAAGSAAVAAVTGVLFTISFAVVVQRGERWAAWLSWSTLLAGALATVVVVTALHARLGADEPELALVAFVLGVAGALGAAVHAAYELSILANPPTVTSTLPSAIDPRGFMTFAVLGLALALFGWLIVRTGALPRDAGRLALAGAALLLVVYGGRLTALDPHSNVIRVAALASGLVVLPAFYGLLGRELLRAPALGQEARP